MITSLYQLSIQTVPTCWSNNMLLSGNDVNGICGVQNPAYSLHTFKTEYTGEIMLCMHDPRSTPQQRNQNCLWLAVVSGIQDPENPALSTQSGCMETTNVLMQDAVGDVKVAVAFTRRKGTARPLHRSLGHLTASLPPALALSATNLRSRSPQDPGPALIHCVP